MTQNQSDKTTARKPRRWTAIDTVLLLLALVVVVGVAFRAIDFFRDDDLQVTRYRVYFTGTQEVYYTVPEQIGERDDVYLYGTSTHLGYIEGACVRSSQQDRYQNVTFSGYFTVDDGVLEQDGRLSVGNGEAYLTVGETVVICTDRVALEIRVDAIEVDEMDRETETWETDTADVITEATVEVEDEEESTEACESREDATDPFGDGQTEDTTEDESVTVPVMEDESQTDEITESVPEESTSEAETEEA